MAPKFQQLGVEAVVAGMAAFNKDINSMQKSVDNAAGNLEKSASSTGALSAAMDVAGVAIGAVTVAVVAATAAIGGMIALMKRGAEIDDIAKSFAILESSIGKVGDQLTALRKGAAGTISDIDLMRKANQALIGTTDEFAKKFAASLPKLLEIARVQANATGQSVSDVFDAEINGIKEAQPRMLNHVGIIVKTTLANEAYAASIGKSVADLTLEEQQQAALNAVLVAGGDVLTRYGGLAESADEKLARLGATAANAIDRLSLAVQPAFKKILDSLQPIFDFLGKLAEASAPYIAALANMFAGLVDKILGPIGDAVKKLNAADIAKGFFEGGARIMGALAGGLAAGAKAVIDVVRTIAQAIANFLIGFSPPPEGPLSTIDVGGANVIKAWLQGFLGVSLDPVSKVAGDVAALMGSAASASSDEVTARFQALDQALLPFQDRLALIRANFDALKPAVDQAFTAIDRQQEQALKALNQGQAGSAEMVRSLDNQRTALQDYVDQQQAQIDAAQIQLALAQAQQAAERAALEIRQRQLPATTTGGIPMGSAQGIPMGEAAVTSTAGAVQAATTAITSDATGGLGGISGALDTLNVDVAKAMQGMKDAFKEGFTGAGGSIQGIKDAIAKLETTWDDLKKKATGVGDWIGAVWITLQTNLSAAWDIIKANAETAWTEFRTSIENAWTTLKTNVESTWGNLRTGLEKSWADFQTWITATIGAIQTTVDNTWNAILDWIDTTLGSIQTSIESTWSNIQTWLTNTIGTIQTTVSNIWNSIRTMIEQVLKAIGDNITIAWNGILNFINGIVGRLRDAFTNISNAIISALQPVLNAIATIQAFLGSGGTGTGTGGLFGANTGPQLPTIRPTPRAGGGSFGANDLLKVGEHGPELATFSQSGYIIANRVAGILASVGNLMAQPAPMPASGGSAAYNNTYNQQQSMGDVNLYGVQDTNDAIRRYALLRALGKVH